MPYVGIMGGTFDPIHYGHLAAAEGAMEALGLDRVLFLPNQQPPHKAGRPVSAAAHRAAMVQLAIAGNPRFQCSDLELKREGPSYTLHTARALKERHPEWRMAFIVGMDSLVDLHTWYEYRTLLSLIDLVVVTRPGYSVEQRDAALAALGPELASHVRVLETPGVAVSATELRERAAQGRSLRYLLPDPVIHYVNEHRLYSGTGEQPAASKMHTPWSMLDAALRHQISGERLAHTYRVVEAARELADRFGVSRAQAEVAALLHDYAKAMPPPRLLAEAQKRGLIVDPAEEKQPHLLHGTVAAALLTEQGLIDDPAIADAIRWHTTGRAGMTALEKVIWLADYIESGRRFPGVDPTRAVARQDLDRALVMAMDSTISHVVSRGWILHLYTIHARNWLVGQLRRT